MSNITNNLSVNNNTANYEKNNVTQTNNANSTQENAAPNTDINNNTEEAAVKLNPPKYKVDTEKIDSLYAEQKNYLNGLQNIINQFKYQASGIALLDSLSQNNSNPNTLYNLANMSKISGLSDMQDYFSLFVRNADGTFSVDLSGLSPEAANELISKAQEDISEDGFWGVKQTSERILNFAKAITGGDPEKMEKMRNIVDKAFKQVAGIFGGLDKMPEISQKTYEAIMEGFDEIAEASQTGNV